MFGALYRYVQVGDSHTCVHSRAVDGRDVPMFGGHVALRVSTRRATLRLEPCCMVTTYYLNHTCMYVRVTVFVFVLVTAAMPSQRHVSACSGWRMIDARRCPNVHADHVSTHRRSNIDDRIITASYSRGAFRAASSSSYSPSPPPFPPPYHGVRLAYVLVPQGRAPRTPP